MRFAPPGTRFENPLNGERTEVLASPAETGDRYRLRISIPAGGGPSRHRHPAFTEEFTVRSGQVRMRVGPDTAALPIGATRRVPVGTAHAFRNTGSERAELDVDIIFEPDAPLPGSDLVRLGAAVAERSKGGGRPPLLELALLLDELRTSTATASLGPAILQRVIIAPLAALARLRGYRIQDPPD